MHSETKSELSHWPFLHHYASEWRYRILSHTFQGLCRQTRPTIWSSTIIHYSLDFFPSSCFVRHAYIVTLLSFAIHLIQLTSHSGFRHYSSCIKYHMWTIVALTFLRRLPE